MPPRRRVDRATGCRESGRPTPEAGVDRGPLDSAFVYTCVTGGYDRTRHLGVSERGMPFLYFTDRPRSAPSGWEPAELMSPPRLISGHDINRYHKIFPHRIAKYRRYSIYIDGSISYDGDFGSLLERFRKAGVALAAFRHPAGRSLEEEFEACLQKGKFDAHDLRLHDRQRSEYRAEGLRLDRPITANYLLVRDHDHPLLKDAMSLWWSQLFEYTKRDQLSLGYALWRTGIPWAFLDEGLGVHPGLLSRRRHSSWRRWATPIRSRFRAFSRIRGRPE